MAEKGVEEQVLAMERLPLANTIIASLPLILINSATNVS